MSTTPYPLGRHVEHDARSLSYLVAPRNAVKTVLWTRRAPIFDQGDLGSCTGNAGAGAMGTDWSHGTGLSSLSEADALALYEAATKLDNQPGSYPPDDTGSTGLAICKALNAEGRIVSYRTAILTDGLTAALQDGPCIVGLPWLSGMDKPDAKGRCHATGTERGGHEVLVRGVDLDAKLYHLDNSWGTDWALGGSFTVSITDMHKLLKMQGDVYAPIRA